MSRCGPYRVVAIGLGYPALHYAESILPVDDDDDYDNSGQSASQWANNIKKRRTNRRNIELKRDKRLTDNIEKGRKERGREGIGKRDTDARVRENKREKMSVGVERTHVPTYHTCEFYIHIFIDMYTHMDIRIRIHTHWQ